VVTDRHHVRPGVLVPRGRLVALLLALAVVFAAVVGRLAFVQGFSAGPYAALGRSERVHAVALPADRGAIFDRHGNELAISVPQSTVWADPRLVTAPAPEAQALAPVLHLDASTIEDKLTRPGAFSYIARRVDDATAAQVRALKLPGVNLLDEPKRFDPAGTLAAPVVGLVGTDNTGLSGLEVQYQSALTGHPGKLVSEDDPSGKPIPGAVSRLTPPTRGSDLVLTIDRSLQYEVEQELTTRILDEGAPGGMAVVLDTHTGEILAMSSLVSNADGTGVVPAPSNQVMTKVYEPGSVNKLITMSAALQEGVVAPTDTMTIPDHLDVAGSLFRDDNAHPTYQGTLTDILTASSNVGTINVARKLGKDRLDEYLRKFGLGSRTALHFPGESSGLLLDPARWSGTSIATVPIGQGIAVTAIQMAAAYNTIANGGVYVAPKLVRAVVDPQGRTVATPPSATHRVVSTATARQMTAMLSEVVRAGTGTAAAIPGYAVAGKTGTARKTVEGQVGYKPGAYTASFGGFVPAESPSLTAMVVLDEPRSEFGGSASAPVFASVASYALRELAVPPPAADPSLFDGVPHASAAVASAADEPVHRPAAQKGTLPAPAAAPAPAPAPGAPPPSSIPATTAPAPVAHPGTTTGPTTTTGGRAPGTSTIPVAPGPTTPHPTTTGPPSPVTPTTVKSAAIAGGAAGGGPVLVATAGLAMPPPATPVGAPGPSWPADSVVAVLPSPSPGRLVPS